MKKNVMMRVASIMLVLVLMSSSVISGTFAKYVTSGESKDSARVAKFGVTVVGSTDMFHDSYLDTFTTYTDSEKLADITVQAESANTDLVAPGTNGVLANFDIEGKPEVDTLVTYAAEVDLGDNWIVNIGAGNEEYCPVVFTIVYNGNTESYGMTGTTAGHQYTTVDALETELDKAIEACMKRYHTNEDLSAAETDFSISWAWAFETGADADAKAKNDLRDTALGNAAANGYAATISLKITCSVTQID